MVARGRSGSGGFVTADDMGREGFTAKWRRLRLCGVKRRQAKALVRLVDFGFRPTSQRALSLHPSSSLAAWR